MKLTVLAEERFSCHGCSDCCRNWHVELLDQEAKQIPALAWPEADPLHHVKVTTTFGGKSFVAHRADGSCVYLNLTTKRCRIHETFGESAKPLGCRLYPFQITRISDKLATVSARFDCPSVQKNVGAPHAESLAGLREISTKISLGPGLDAQALCGLDLEQAQAVAQFASAMLGSFEHAAHKALFIYLLADMLGQMPTEQVNRQTLGQAYASLREGVLSISPARVMKPTATVRLSFRSLWALYLRRDEDVLDKRVSRVGRALALARVSLLGSGALSGLGLSHRKASIARAKLFSENHDTGDNTAEAMTAHWRMIKSKLESLQFMGPANHGKNLIDGLRSLALLYPLVLAAARVSAAGREGKTVEAQDVEYAVGAVEHGFGRSPVLKTPAAVVLEQTMLAPAHFVRIVCRV